MTSVEVIAYYKTFYKVIYKVWVQDVLNYAKKNNGHKMRKLLTKQIFIDCKNNSQRKYLQRLHNSIGEEFTFQ